MKTQLASAFAAFALLATTTVYAHHAFAAEFDKDKPVSITGTVSKIEWGNPHAYLFVDVKGDKPAEVTNWKFELGGRRALEKRGWKQTMIKAGDEVTVNGWRAKDGSNYGNANDVKLPTGRELNAASSYFDSASTRSHDGN
jgi:hypothetical protein